MFVLKICIKMMPRVMSIAMISELLYSLHKKFGWDPPVPLFYNFFIIDPNKKIVR